LHKTPTGIKGFDEITEGGLPKNRTTLFSGSTGNKIIADFKPHAVVIDPLTSLIGQGNQLEVQSMLTRTIDVLKSKGITGFFTSLVSSTAQNDTSSPWCKFGFVSRKC